MHVLILISNKLIYREKVMSRETYALRKVVHDEESVANEEREVWWAGVHADKQVSNVLLERSDIYIYIFTSREQYFTSRTIQQTQTI